MKKTPPQKKTNNKMPEDRAPALPHPPTPNTGRPSGKPGPRTKFKPKLQQNLKTGKVQHG